MAADVVLHNICLCIGDFYQTEPVENIEEQILRNDGQNIDLAKSKRYLIKNALFYQWKNSFYPFLLSQKVPLTLPFDFACKQKVFLSFSPFSSHSKKIPLGQKEFKKVFVLISARGEEMWQKKFLLPKKNSFWTK